MAGRYIIHENGRRITGVGPPPEGVPFHWITQTGSLYMNNDILLVDGQEAPTGDFVLDCGEEEVPIEVAPSGTARRHPKRAKGQGKPDNSPGGGGNGGAKK